MNKKPALNTFRVYVEQVNQQMVIVKAYDKEEALKKGYALWRRNYAHSRISDVVMEGDDGH
jgi:hypothetical protein